MKRKWIYILLATLFCVACTTEDDPVMEKEQGTILFGNVDDGGTVSWMNGRSNSRSVSRAGEIEAKMPDNIGVFAFGDGANTTYIFRNQKVYLQTGSEYDDKFAWNYEGNVWPYTINADETVSEQKKWQMMRYRFFAYSPYFESQYVRAEAENYSGFNKFYWSNIPGFSKYDFMLANSIVEMNNRSGEFKTGRDVVSFQMRHILSRIRFFFKMSPEYRELRRIVITKLTVLTAGKVKSATFNFANNEWDKIVNWTNEVAGDAPPAELLCESGDSYEVPPLGNGEWPEEPFNSVYVYPQTDFSELKFQIEYEVYDRAGIKTRDASVTNIVNLKPAWTLRSGYYYDVKINIVPDYLYVLSDNDQDFDGYVIIKDN